ncbi:MAG: DnaJ domain-containing protein [Micavibrio sp.]|nr:DnaJ domain-containing protein [Micavibrio sp.]
MPYLLLVIGLLIGLFAFYRFFMNAKVRQIKALFLSVFLAAIAIALLVLALTGKLIAALALLIPLAPVLRSAWIEWKGSGESQKENVPQQMTRNEAYKVLGLEEGASEEEIKSAYKKLMQKVHPDAEGSEWLAARLNEARDFLIKAKK